VVGVGCNNSNNNFFFMLLIWVGFFKWGFCTVFVKSVERVSCSFLQQSPIANIKKPLEKTLQILFRKDLPTYAPGIKQPLEQKQLNTHNFFGFFWLLGCVFCWFGCGLRGFVFTCVHGTMLFVWGCGSGGMLGMLLVWCCL